MGQDRRYDSWGEQEIRSRYTATLSKRVDNLKSALNYIASQDDNWKEYVKVILNDDNKLVEEHQKSVR